MMLNTKNTLTAVNLKSLASDDEMRDMPRRFQRDLIRALAKLVLKQRQRKATLEKSNRVLLRMLKGK